MSKKNVAAPKKSASPAPPPAAPAAAPAPTIITAIYAGAFKKTPHNVEARTWPELCADLTALANEPTRAPASATTKAQKEAMPAWSPHVLAPGTTCAKANVTEVTALVLDCDDGDPAAVLERLRANGWAGLVYASPSDTPELRKFRVVSPVTKSIAQADCGASRLAFAEAIGLVPGRGVEDCLDASRILFAGRLHNTPPREVWTVEGHAVDVAALPAPRHNWGPARPAAASAATPAAPGTAYAPGRVASVVGALYAGHDVPGKRVRIRAIVGTLCRAGWTDDDVLSVVEALPTRYKPDRLAVAKAEVAAYRAGRMTAGWTSLRDLMGDDVANRLGDVLEPALASVIGSWKAHAEARAEAARKAAASPNAPRILTGGEGAPVGDHFADVIEDFGEDEPLAYLCKSLCLTPIEGKVIIIGGLPGAGKGPIASHLAVAFGLGVPAFGRFACTQANALIVDVEGARLTKRRIRRAALALGRKPSDTRGHVFLKNASKSGDLRDAAFLDSLRTYIAKRQIGVLILDSYSSAMLSTDEDPNKPSFATLAQALSTLGVLVIIIAHARKPPQKGERPSLADIAGSGVLGAMASTGISVWRPDEDDKDAIRIGCMRAPEEGFATLDLRFEDTPNGGLAITVSTTDEADRVARDATRAKYEALAANVIAFLRRCVGAPKTERAIADAPEVKAKAGADRPLHAVLSAMHAAGILRHETGARRDSGGDYTLISEAECAVFSTDLQTCKPAPRGPGSVAAFIRPAAAAVSQ